MRTRWLRVARGVVMGLLLVVSTFVNPMAKEPARIAFPLTQLHTAAAVNGYQPSQIRHAYGFDRVEATGAGALIAIVVAYGSPTITGDLTQFSNQFGLPAANLVVAYPQGQPDKSNYHWALETSLSVEWAHALAPAATILLVVSKSDYVYDLLDGVDYATEQKANVVSMSWGVAEFPDEMELDCHFDHSRVAYIAAAGDFGSEPLWPATSIQVLAVGGTTLALDTIGDRIGPELAWRGTSHGPSRFEPEAKYQSLYGTHSQNHRLVPDVAFLADPHAGVAVYDTTGYNGSRGWFVLGGTSLGAPAWAALLALQGLPIPTVPESVYKLARLAHHDLVQPQGIGEPGKNGTDHYSVVTGLGTPAADKLYLDLWKWLSPTFYVASTNTLSIKDQNL